MGKLKNTTIYQPKGGMCARCQSALAYCSKLEFQNMPVHKKDDECVVVICTKFKKG